MEDQEEVKIETTKCLNCGNTFEGNFCPHCSQKAKTKRLKLSEIIGDFVNSFIGGDNKFVRTCHDLIVRPGHMVREYLLGHRCQYYNPLQMLVYIITVYSILTYLLGGDPFKVHNFDTDLGLENGSMGKEFMDGCWNLARKIFSNKLYVTIIGALSAVIPYRFIFRKFDIQRPDNTKLPLNYTENFYTLLYQSCAEMMFATILLPFCLIRGSEDILSRINSIADFVISVILFKQLLNISWKNSFKRNIYSIILTAMMILAVIIQFVLVFLLCIGIIAGIKEVIEGM